MESSLFPLFLPSLPAPLSSPPLSPGLVRIIAVPDMAGSMFRSFGLPPFEALIWSRCCCGWRWGMSCCASASHSHVRTDPATSPGSEDSPATYLDPHSAPAHSTSAPKAPDEEGCLPVGSACRAVQAQVLAASRISKTFLKGTRGCISWPPVSQSWLIAVCFKYGGAKDP